MISVLPWALSSREVITSPQNLTSNTSDPQWSFSAANSMYISGNSSYPNNFIYRLFDGKSTTFWNCSSAYKDPDFAITKTSQFTVARFLFKYLGDLDRNVTYHFRLDYSADGSTWTSAGTQTISWETLISMVECSGSCQLAAPLTVRALKFSQFRGASNEVLYYAPNFRSITFYG